MTNTYNHAKTELDILFKTTPTSCINDFKNEILALCEKFGQSGQSGGSAPYTASILANVIKSLCMQQTISPILGDDDEWGDVNAINNGKALYQNKRDSAVFKDGKYGKAYYIDAIVKCTQKNITYSGAFWLNREEYIIGDKNLKIGTRGYIKSFPFEPKTFYIDVIEEEVAPDDWEMYCKDESQLDEVWKYYDKE